MDCLLSDESESRFAAYVEGLVGAIGHADRAAPLRDYCLGLLVPGERKSVEPMAAVTAPSRVAAQHQSLLHFVGNAPWSEYWLSTLPPDISLASLVDMAKLRWRIERDYQELKQELGLGHYEGRGWRGFHHHATLCIAAYGFLIAERGSIPPSGPDPAAKFQKPTLPAGYRPRGAADPAGTPHPELNRHSQTAPQRRSRQHARSMSVLPCTATTGIEPAPLMTQ